MRVTDREGMQARCTRKCPAHSRHNACWHYLVRSLSKPATEISDPARLSAQLQRHKAVRIL